ncbi:MAG: hypothetical protein R3C58_04615 [Parvularculaceae bacterium]
MRRSAFAALFLAAACSAQNAAAPEKAVDPAAVPTLEQLWIAEGFSAPEGVAAAPGGGYFISNVGGDGEAKDGEGWISVISTDGKVVTERFTDGLDAPKGMAVMDGVLYATDIDTVRIIDAATGARTGDVVIEGAQFLNDATVWNGAIYVSDSGAASIYKLENGEAKLWLKDERLGGVNGLLGSGGVMFVSTMNSGSLFAAGADGMLTEIASGMENADGIGEVPGGGWLVSAWPGGVFFVSPEGETTEILNTRDAQILQNDLTMFGDIVIVPNWLPGTVTAWKAVR